MHILGVSGFYHDSAAALVVDGRIVAAAQEERFTRRKHDDRFPAHAIGACLNHAGLSPDAVDYVAFYEKPFLRFERLIDTYLAFAPRGYANFSAALPVWIHDKLFQKWRLRDALTRLGFERQLDERLLFAEHHQSHAASAFYPSPFSEAIVLTMDGVGEWATTSVSIGNGRALKTVREIQFPHSLGLLYSAFTYYTGFKVNSGEYKVMGLAPYGAPRFVSLILDTLIDVKADGSFRLNLDYFDYCTGLRMTNDRMDRLFGRPVRGPEKPLEQFHMDVVASIQAVTDEIMLRLTRALAAEFRLPNLCLAGGVALNCVSNGKILRDGRFERLWIQRATPVAPSAPRWLPTTCTQGTTEFRLKGQMPCRGATLVRRFPKPISRSGCVPWAPRSRRLPTMVARLPQPLTRSPAKRLSVGSRDGWNSAPGHSARDRFWGIRVRPQRRGS